jgi:hypothetical protein
MEKFFELAKQALKSYTVADHMVHVTYNVVKEPKLLMLATKHLDESLTHAISALIYYDYYYKRISEFPSNFTSKLDIFRRFTCQKYAIPRQVVQLIQDIHNIVKDHKSSEMEFRRKNQYVIASKSYQLRTINIEKLKSFLNISKTLITKLTEVKKLNDRRAR